MTKMKRKKSLFFERCLIAWKCFCWYSSSMEQFMVSLTWECHFFIFSKSMSQITNNLSSFAFILGAKLLLSCMKYCNWFLFLKSSFYTFFLVTIWMQSGSFWLPLHYSYYMFSRISYCISKILQDSTITQFFAIQFLIFYSMCIKWE